MTTDEMINDIREELARAREKFPDNKHQLSAFSEEAGELAQALMHRQYEGGTDAQVYKEAVQAAVTAIRVGTEGDHSFFYDPGKAKVRSEEPLIDSDYKVLHHALGISANQSVEYRNYYLVGEAEASSQSIIRLCAAGLIVDTTFLDIEDHCEKLFIVTEKGKAEARRTAALLRSLPTE